MKHRLIPTEIYFDHYPEDRETKFYQVGFARRSSEFNFCIRVVTSKKKKPELYDRGWFKNAKVRK